MVVDMLNLLCRFPAEIIERHNPEQTTGFVKAANHKRGVVGWIESEGAINTGDAITLWISPRRIYAHA